MEGFTRTRCAFLEVGVAPTMIPTVGGSPSGSGYLLDSPFGVCRPAEVDKGTMPYRLGWCFTWTRRVLRAGPARNPQLALIHEPGKL